MDHVHDRQIDEQRRLAALRRYQILDTPPDGTFDRITALATRLLGTPIAVLSLVDEDRIWFKSRHGLPGVNQLDREPGLCASAILSDDAYVLEDASIDPRSLANPLVAGEFGLRFYAGHPLRTSDGNGLGVLCCLDFEPRKVTQSDLANLADLAAVVMDQMELRLAARNIDSLHRQLKQAHDELHHLASHDSLTGTFNRRAIMAAISDASAQSMRTCEPASVMMIDIDHFKQVNDTQGHVAGDTVLAEVARRLQAAIGQRGTIGRLGGEEFLCVLNGHDAGTAHAIADQCRVAVCAEPIQVDNGSLDVSVSIGVADLASTSDRSVADSIRHADTALYEAKRTGRNRVSSH